MSGETTELTELTGLAFESGSSPLTTTPVVGTPRRSYLGSGALKNFNGLRLPVTSTTKVFLSHLHVGDMPTLVWSLAKAGRRDPVEVWGPASHPRAETRG